MSRVGAPTCFYGAERVEYSTEKVVGVELLVALENRQARDEERLREVRQMRGRRAGRAALGFEELEDVEELRVEAVRGKDIIVGHLLLEHSVARGHH